MTEKKQKTILIIDDDVQFTQMLKKTITRHGYSVITATDGETGIMLYRKSPTDLVITDIILDKKQGIEIIQDLKKEFPDIKIIAISGGGYMEPELFLKFAADFGAEYTFRKPIDRKQLMDTIEKLIGKPIIFL